MFKKRMIGWIENDSWLHQMRMMGYGWFIGIDGGEMFHEFWFGMVVSTGFFVGVGSTSGARAWNPGTKIGEMLETTNIFGCFEH